MLMQQNAGGADTPAIRPPRSIDAITICLEPTMPPSTEPGPLLLALHSSGASGRQWDPYRHLPPQPARWHTPALLGYGNGEAWALDAPLDLDAEAARFDALLGAAGEGVHLVGHSYGGAVALQLARRWPHRVRSLTLYEPVRFALLREGDAALWQEVVTVGRAIGAEVLLGRPEVAAQRFVDYWSGAGAWGALTAGRRQAVVVRMPKVRAEFEALFADPLSLAELGRLPVPVRLLCGSRSPRPALRVVERLAQVLPQATLERLDGLGHLGPIEAPARVAARLAVHAPPAAFGLAA